MPSIYSQLELPLPDFDSDRREIKPNEDKPTGNRLNSISPQDRAFHEWYRFVLSFSPHLVRDYLQDFGLDEVAWQFLLKGIISWSRRKNCQQMSWPIIERGHYRARNML